MLHTADSTSGVAESRPRQASIDDGGSLNPTTSSIIMSLQQAPQSVAILELLMDTYALWRLRYDLDNLSHTFIYIVTIIMNVINVRKSKSFGNIRNSDDVMPRDSSSIDVIGDYGDDDRIDLDISLTEDNFENFIEVTSPKFQRRAISGSPFNINIMSSTNTPMKIKSASDMNCNEKLVKVNSDEDFRMQFWSILPKFAEISPEMTSNNKTYKKESESGNVKESYSMSQLNALQSPLRNRELKKKEGVEDAAQIENVSSAYLCERMRVSRSRIRQIQRSIRKVAEQPSAFLEKVESLLDERKKLSIDCASDAADLFKHVQHVKTLQTSRSKQLSNVLSEIEEMIQQPEAVISDPASDYSNVSCGWEEWNLWVQEASTQINIIPPQRSRSDIENLRIEMRAIARFSTEISEWITRGSIDSPSILTPHGTMRPDSISRAAFEATSQKIRQLGQDYEDAVVQANLVRNRAILSVRSESEDIRNALKRVCSIVEEAKYKGHSVISSMINQLSFALLEILDLENEVSEWYNLVQELCDEDNKLTTKCNLLVEDNQKQEEKLIELENAKIDIRSALEKLSLRSGHVKRSKSRTQSILPLSDGGNSEENGSNAEEELKTKLKIIESEIKTCRRNMRLWFREVREFAIVTAPELFFALPDLLSVGSILGDGGFAEAGKLAKRQLDDYDNVEFMFEDDKSISHTKTSTNSVDSKSESVAISDQTGGKGKRRRHLLLKAKYDDKDIVLKGFFMEDHSQRSGLEKEVNLLADLSNEFVIVPTGLVDDLSVDMKVSSSNNKRAVHEWSRYKGTVFIEYPYFSCGNLKDWVGIAGKRKVWELQAVARQLLFAISYLHDHKIVHKVLVYVLDM